MVLLTFTDLRDGRMLIHRGDLSDLAAQTWECPESYMPTLEHHWTTMAVLYRACLAVGPVPASPEAQACFALYTSLIRPSGEVPSTAELVDACCAVAHVSLLPMERHLHIRLLKQALAIDITVR